MPDPTALEAALAYLSRRSYSRQKLSEKLDRAGFDPTAVKAAVNRLGGWGYLNDQQFGWDRVAQLQQRLKSRTYVEGDLLAQGLAAPLVTAILTEKYPEELELELARRLLNQKANSLRSREAGLRLLARAGYSETTIRHCFPELAAT